MAAFFADQLDFILFFYGLAFILLGAVCFAVARGSAAASAPSTVAWGVLGLFAYLHGAGEWLDLIALIFGDTTLFALGRTALMTASYMVLLDFGRLETSRCGFRVPGRWIYAPLLILVVLGWHWAGISGANAAARYTFGLSGSLLSGAILLVQAKRAPHLEGRWLSIAALALALYAIAAGAIVSPTPIWAGDVFNYETFTHTTGMPVQLVRGLIACLLAFAIWAYWGQRLTADVASARYAEFQRKQFYGTLVAFGAILVAGWILTEILGNIYKHNVEQESKGDINLIASRLALETTAVDSMARVLAGTEEITRVVAPGDRSDTGRAKSILTLDTEAARANEGYILDRQGKVRIVADSVSASIGDDFSAAPYFRQSIAGEPAYHFQFDQFDSTPYYFASYPLRVADGGVSGVVVLKKRLGGFESDLKTFDRSFALIDQHGIVLLTNRPEMRFRTLWPLPQKTVDVLTLAYGPISSRPAIQREVYTSDWLTFDGNREYVQRRSADHGGWSLVTWKAPQGIFAGRVLGIVITLQLTIIALVYLVGREHWIHNNVQLEKRLELEELARKLDNRATTDPLTGLFNRRKFDQALSAEILRAHRYGTPLSLIMYDADRFKTINDNFGHLAGDAVLIKLSRHVSSRLRASDVLARWGGEEFVILCPGSDAAMAAQLAESMRTQIETLPFKDTGAVTCSFGVAQFMDGDTPEALIARTDEALYRAKSTGRNRVEVGTQLVASSPSLQPAG